MSEYNVCGVLVMTRPEKGAVVEQALNEMEGVEVHARGDDGRLVVTVEGTQGHLLADTITGLAGIEGVISTSLVYHEIDTEEFPQESAQ